VFTHHMPPTERHTRQKVGDQALMAGVKINARPTRAWQTLTDHWRKFLRGLRAVLQRVRYPQRCQSVQHLQKLDTVSPP